MEVFGYVASVVIGFVLGLLGGGGSILSIPILVYLFHIDAVTASAYSLFIVGTTSFAGAIPKYKDHLVNIKTGFLFGIPSIVAIFITRRWIVPSIPDILYQTESFIFTKRLLLLGIFALLMILASVSMIRGRKENKMVRGSMRIPLTIIEGILIGFLTGLVGAGGGFLIIPALIFLTRLPMKTASGTSLFIIAINSLFGFAGDLFTMTMDWPFLLKVTALAIVGVHFGNVLSKRVSNRQLRVGFGCLKYQTRLDTIQFSIKDRRYRISESNLLDASGNVVLSYLSSGANGWKPLRSRTGNRLFNAASQLQPFGVWRVVSYRYASGDPASDHDPPELTSLVGSDILFNLDRVVVRTETCSSPIFDAKTITNEEFVKRVGSSIESLGIPTDKVDAILLVCESKNSFPSQTFMLRLPGNKALMLWDGVFLELERTKNLFLP